MSYAQLAIATYDGLSEYEKDDHPFHAALRENKIEFDLVSWEDSSARWDDYDACLIRTTWNYQYHCDAFVKWAERVSRCTQLFNPYEIIAWNVRKTYLRKLERLGVPIAPTLWLSPGDSYDLGAWLDRCHGNQGFIKPVVGATSRETLKFDRTKDQLQVAKTHLDRLLAKESMMVQPYLTSVEEEGEISFILIDGHVTHAVRKVPRKGDYRVQDDFGAHDEPYPLSDSDRIFAESVMDLIEHEALYGRVDCLSLDDGQRVLVELELIEPSLFFRHASEAAFELAKAIKKRLDPDLVNHAL